MSIIMTCILSCSNGYEQNYKTFDEFNQMNQRNKGWFPPIIYSDATKLRNISYLDSQNAFGKFSYKNSELYDLIFSKNQEINVELFENEMRNNSKNKPNWFLNLEMMDKTNLEIIKVERFFILKNKNEKEIYYILSQ